MQVTRFSTNADVSVSVIICDNVPDDWYTRTAGMFNSREEVLKHFVSIVLNV